MFGISFLAISYSNVYEILFSSTPVQYPLLQIAENMEYWSFYPVLIAIGIAVHKRFFQTKDFNVFFRLFSVLILTTCILIVFNPLPAHTYAALFAIAIGMECMIVSGIISLKNKEFSDFLFFLALLFNIGGGYTLAIGNYQPSIILFFVGFLFLAIVLYWPKIASGEHQSSITKVFTLQQQLVETKTALDERERTFQTLFNQMADPVMILDKKGTFLELTDKVKEYTGFEKNEILGKNFLRTKLLTPKSKAICIKNLGKRMAGMEVKPYEVEALTKDGEKIPFEVNAQRIIYKGKKADMVVFRDISERKKAEESKRHYLENLLFLSETVTELNKTSTPEEVYEYIGKRIEWLTKNTAYVFITSFDEKRAKFILSNIFGFKENLKKTLNMFGLKPIDKGISFDINEHWMDKLTSGTIITPSQEELKQLIFPFVKPEIYPLLQKFLNINEVYVFSITKEGKIFGCITLAAHRGKTIGNLDTIETFVHQAAVAIQRNQFMQELTEFNRNLEEKVAQRTERIQQLLHQKDEFVNQLGHDLKNPLNPLVNLIPLLEVGEEDPERKKVFQVVNRNVGYMKNLVQKTLELARLNAPNATINFEHVNLYAQALNALDTNSFKLQEKSIQVNVTISKNITVSADKLLLDELLNNVIDNAVKYSPNGGNITIDASEEKNDVLVSIRDEGMGISKDQLGHIFEEFYKADGSRHDFYSSGLGMSICKRIAERHGGSIWVESDGLGKGSTFFFTLPRVVQESNDQFAEPTDDISIKVDRILGKIR
jgi:PAS domain S-box-containing protein